MKLIPHSRRSRLAWLAGYALAIATGWGPAISKHALAESQGPLTARGPSSRSATAESPYQLQPYAPSAYQVTAATAAPGPTGAPSTKLLPPVASPSSGTPSRRTEEKGVSQAPPTDAVSTGAVSTGAISSGAVLSDTVLSDTILSNGADSTTNHQLSSSPRLRLRRDDGSRTADAAIHPSAQRTETLVSRWAQGSTITAASALALVLGLFLLFAWVVKRGLPRSSQRLPAEAVTLLGRTPLGARQFAHLLHVGNKLVLVSVTAGGVETLAEVDDPQQVDRIVGLCSQANAGSSSRAFHDVFAQFAQENAPPGFLGHETLPAGGRRA